jgi:hypothetical protein
MYYPLGWEVKEDGTSSVSFRSPEPVGVEAVLISANIKGASKYLDTNDMKVKEHTPQEYAWGKSNLPTDWHFKAIREKAVTVAGYPGWRLEYTTTPDFLGGSISNYQVVTDFVSNSRVYFIEFLSDPLKVPDALPLYDKMVDSFQLK